MPGTLRVVSGSTRDSFQPRYKTADKETDFQGDKQYYKAQRRKVVGLGNFLWMTEDMRWFQGNFLNFITFIGVTLVNELYISFRCTFL